MSTPTELWKKWEGRVVEGKFPLRQWLGGSDHSVVFLTERAGKEPRKAAIKLIPVDQLHRENLDEAAQLSRWAGAARLSRPHLIRLFEYGRCQIGDTRLLYVVMEYAEENLAEILPLRPLSPAEASEMLPPGAEALASLYLAGFVHGRIKPSNIMAVNNQLKISSDGLRKAGEHGDVRAPGAYDAPEVPTVGLSPAADIWSLGATLLAVLTQSEPRLKSGEPKPPAVPETIPQPLRDILRQCLKVDPQQRCKASDILNQIPPAPPPIPAPVVAKLVEAHLQQQRSKRWIAVPIVVAALFLAAWVGRKFIAHSPRVPAAETVPAKPPVDAPAVQLPAALPVNEKPAQNEAVENRPAKPPADTPVTQPPVPLPVKEKPKPAQTGAELSSVLEQVQPDVSRGALNTIQGHVKVSVRVSVDASGNVSEAKLVSPGPSKYFASRALSAARRWRFNPPKMDGQPTASEWVLRFQFGRTSTQVFPAETDR
jgi:TonB family protein